MKIIYGLIVGLLIGGLAGVGLTYFYWPLEPDEIHINLLDLHHGHTLSDNRSFEFYDLDFANKVRQQLISAETSFLEADLFSMELKLYEGGEIIEIVPIRAKGKKGSWWETPSGLYQVEAKLPNHFSSMSRVYMPWSIHFHGNFFIHGWPYLSNGQMVRSDTSGGCIRLKTEDAKKIYDLTKIGMPVLVYHEEKTQEKIKYEFQPEIEADSFLIVDMDNNFVFFDKDSNSNYQLNYLTNLLIGVVSFEYINLTTPFNVLDEMLVESFVPRLESGKKISVYNLLFPLLMESSFEAAKALALLRGEDLFIKRLNDKASSLGMDNTYFYSIDLDNKENISSARDLFLLADYINKNRSLVFEISSLEEITPDIESSHGQLIWPDLKNLNHWSRDEDFVGGMRTTVDNGKESAILVFNVKISGIRRKIAFIILESIDLDGDVERIRNSIEVSFSIKDLK